MMDVRPIKTEADYEWALKEIERYFDEQPDPGTPDGDRFDVLATLIEAYENLEFPPPEADPVAILHFAIEDMGRSQADLARIMGSRSRASEVLNRRRHLTVQMIHDISREWHLSADLLARPYALAQDKPVVAQNTVNIRPSRKATFAVFKTGAVKRVTPAKKNSTKTASKIAASGAKKAGRSASKKIAVRKLTGRKPARPSGSKRA
jgi:HTH-type transcriptional regulator/antitoxin HigA